MKYILFTSLIFWSYLLCAQEKQIPYPRLSPLEKTEIQIALVDFTLEYSKPSMRGRKVFGELEQFNEVWRTGANKNIKLSFDEPVVFKNDTLPPGTYTIFTKPNKEKWTVLIYELIDEFGVPKNLNDYHLVSSFNVPPVYLNNTIETLDISFGNFTYASADLELRWENTLISIPISIPYSIIIDQRLQDALNILASDYATTAEIYFSKAKDSDMALKYLDLCTSTRQGDQTFEQWLGNIQDKNLGLPWAHMIRSNIYAEQKNYKKAIDEAKLSLAIADVVGSNYYRKENTTNIKKWEDK